MEESRLNKPQRGRKLRAVERELVDKMMAGKDVKPGTEATLSSVLVEDMSDGGMGSIRFLKSNESESHLGKAVAKAEYTDEDGVLVSIVINVDQDGDLYEVDFWKVDFSPLKRYPRASDITIEP